MPSSIEPLERLSEQFARLSGIGRKTAQRLAFAVIEGSDEQAEEFARAILDAKKTIHECPVCCDLTDGEICGVCSDEKRDRTTVCVVEGAKDVMALEKVREYKGLYHVLHGALSPMNGVKPEDIRLKELLSRLKDGEVKEVIIATNPNVEGEATAMYISRLIKPLGVTVSRLAYGVPVGGDLEYADEVTLYRALEGRREY